MAKRLGTATEATMLQQLKRAEQDRDANKAALIQALARIAELQDPPKTSAWRFAVWLTFFVALFTALVANE